MLATEVENDEAILLTYKMKECVVLAKRKMTDVDSVLRHTYKVLDNDVIAYIVYPRAQEVSPRYYDR